MKIAYLVSRFPHLYQTFVRRELNEVARQGANITVFPVVGARRRGSRTKDGGCSVSAEIVYTPLFSVRSFLFFLGRRPWALLRLPGLLLVQLWAQPVNLFKSLVACLRALRIAELLVRGGYDHVHAHWATHPATAALAVSELTGIPFTFAFHAYDIFSTRIMIRQKIRRAAAVVINCRYTLKYLKRLFPDAEDGKLHLVYNGVDLDVYEQVERKPEKDPPLVLAIGQLVPSKGFPVLLEALRLLTAEGREVKAVIVGSGPQQGVLRCLIRQKGLDSVVELAGALPEDEVRRALGRATVLAAPCIEPETGSHDGLPNVIIEAAAAGVPVVASDLFGVPELIEHEVSGLLVPERKPDALKTAIARVLDDPGAAARWAARAGERARESFDTHKNARALLAIFEQAVLRSGPASTDATGAAENP